MEFLGTMSGPDFLVLFLVWFAFTYGAVLVCRAGGMDSPMLTLGGIALFEALAVVRFIAGIQHGMHRWNIMFIMMIVGGIIFAIRKGDIHSAGGGSAGAGSSGCGSSGSSSSCGGGGSSCGGGGCGGCGGS